MELHCSQLWKSGRCQAHRSRKENPAGLGAVLEEDVELLAGARPSWWPSAHEHNLLQARQRRSRLVLPDALVASSQRIDAAELAEADAAAFLN